MFHRIAGPIAALLAYVIAHHYLAIPAPAAWTLATTVWVAWWWISETIAIPATSLLPFVLLPLGGITSAAEVSGALGNPIILLFMAAFMLAKAVELSGVHKRIALTLVRRIGNNNPQRMVFSFMVATAFLSMWISNTAAVLALLPVALALADASPDQKFQRALLLGLAYSASVGGIGTLIGTPPNLIFASVYESYTGTPFGFTRWLQIGIPLVIIGIPMMAWWLTRGITTTSAMEIEEPGPVRSAEKRVVAVFGIVIFLWMTRTAPFGGWASISTLSYMNDATIAFIGVLILFIWQDKEGNPLLTWRDAVEIPWGILLLFAGGIALAEGFVNSGLSEIIGHAVADLGNIPTWMLVFIVTISVSALTEVTSNTASATLLMPVMAATATALDMPPELLMIPAAIACSCAFCLPVATPPNSIVFSANRLSIKEMAKEGIVLSIMMAFLTTLIVMLLVY
ncbi:solute carrier family 13 (sodium-dependent dicarboxylate transporter), member 2/3/5 [Pseudidiomarina indica]|uniref:Solute carrier family 13 (Sodium-dependent dicarboxylate transporter), member 2/3/5 n=1 Tax=Pseudidiomarina indica TaxID=1159017 RepID=A0A1G6AP22_9GAMM|nr:SLC13 family permease [Pseudidiomarina indica]SDB10184.1 solute carrier family 13 (sodium-dependent dicarboxylate transporter), member 2/3/5 [Pseudidiomarina indica]